MTRSLTVSGFESENGLNGSLWIEERMSFRASSIPVRGMTNKPVTFSGIESENGLNGSPQIVDCASL